MKVAHSQKAPMVIQELTLQIVLSKKTSALIQELAIWIAARKKTSTLKLYFFVSFLFYYLLPHQFCAIVSSSDASSFLVFVYLFHRSLYIYFFSFLYFFLFFSWKIFILILRLNLFWSFSLLFSKYSLAFTK